MKKCFFPSVFFALVVAAAWMAAIPQAVQAKVGGVIGSADLKLTGCTKDSNTNNKTGTKCQTLQLTVNVKTLLPNHQYTTYIADSACPSSAALLTISGVASNGKGVLSESLVRSDGPFYPVPDAENVCIYDSAKSPNPQTGTPVARGHLIDHTSGKNRNEHGMIHRIAEN